MPFKGFASSENIRLIMLTGSLFAGCPRPTEEQSGISTQQGIHDGAFANSAWT
jgi:hypothetical protein